MKTSDNFIKVAISGIGNTKKEVVVNTNSIQAIFKEGNKYTIRCSSLEIICYRKGNDSLVKFLEGI